MKKGVLTTLLLLSTLCVAAKSLVITLNDKKSTRVYYLLSTDTPPRMVIDKDGTFTVNGQDYAFSNVKYFEISKTDYSGEKNTVDGIVAVQNDEVLMKGTLRVYTLEGRLIQTAASRAELKGLSRGTYIITNGSETIKIRKQ